MSHLDPNFENFFTESLISYFGLLRENLVRDCEEVNITFYQYVNCSKNQFERVRRVRDQFLKIQGNRNLFALVKENLILPIYYEFFNSNYLQIINDIITSAEDLFFNLALDSSENIQELFF
ncbi:MAG: hypothetical protein ACFFD7_15090 [Candidatus Thorarchaeota archaeon]